MDMKRGDKYLYNYFDLYLKERYSDEIAPYVEFKFIKIDILNNNIYSVMD